MIKKLKINIPKQDIVSFCRKHNIKKLSIYGSALRGDLKPESDIDILVEFYKEFIPGFFKLVDMEEELSLIFGGRKVDLRTPNDLSRYFRNEVLETAEALHVES
ncbi:nucleotidyltransferase family protein [Candidatus Contubernalis alkaliaceticus]|uniref:nucleotidyltransferase family protein n=1 Tax=Candidatus Contubernalis alkaliaceticus TaxID=338645 RepID=UPI001F4BF339|nr:nucleotidyltransferase family protein [Candidatus Contubernalis alkalaceticus]